MLTRNCETEKSSLIYPGDFNVRVTVCTPKSRFLQEDAYYPAWIGTLMDSFGGSILNSDEVKTFSIKRIDKKNPYILRRTGKELIKSIKFLFQKPVSFRLEILEDNPRVWIFLMEKDI